MGTEVPLTARRLGALLALMVCAASAWVAPAHASASPRTSRTTVRTTTGIPTFPNETETAIATVEASSGAVEGTIAFLRRNGEAHAGCGEVPVSSSDGVAVAHCRWTVGAEDVIRELSCSDGMATFTPAGGSTLQGSSSEIIVCAQAAPTMMTVSASSISPHTDEAVTYTARVSAYYAGPLDPEGSVEFFDVPPGPASRREYLPDWEEERFTGQIPTCESQPLLPEASGSVGAVREGGGSGGTEREGPPVDETERGYESATLVATCSVSYATPGTHWIRALHLGNGAFEGDLLWEQPLMVTVTGEAGSAQSSTAGRSGAGAGRGVVSVRHRRLTAAAGGAAVMLACDGGEPCAGVLSLLGASAAASSRHAQGHALLLGRAPYAIAAGRTKTIHVRLARIARSLLASHPAGIHATLKLVPRGSRHGPTRTIPVTLSRR